MAETGNDKREGRTGHDHAQRDGVQRADGKAYTAADAAHFDRLTDALRRSAGSEALRGVPASPPPPTPAFDYSESDAQAFGRLMDRLSGARGVRQGQTANQRKAGQGFGYSDDDDRLFADLMAAGRFSAQATATGPELSPAPEPANGGFSYTDRDNEAFARIVSGTPMETGPDETEASSRPAKRDRDVGPIRIVEFDKDHARARQSERRGNLNIKVRYFD